MLASVYIELQHVSDNVEFAISVKKHKDVLTESPYFSPASF